MKRRSRRFEYRGDGQWTVNCSCGVTFDDGEKMVSCDDCGVRVHARCYRFVRGEASFLCLKCTPSASDDFSHNQEVTEFADILVELSTKTQRCPLPGKRRKDIESGEGKQVSWKENAKCHSDKALTNINVKAGSVFESRKDDSGENRGLQIGEYVLPGASQVMKERLEREKLETIQSAANAAESSQREGAAAPSVNTLVLGSSPNDAAEHPVGESMNRRECEVIDEQMISRVHLLLDEGTQTFYEVIVEKDASSETKEEISLLKQRVAMLETQFTELQSRTKEEEDGILVVEERLKKMPPPPLFLNRDKYSLNRDLPKWHKDGFNATVSTPNLKQHAEEKFDIAFGALRSTTTEVREHVEEGEKNVVSMTPQQKHMNDILKQHDDLVQVVIDKDKGIAAEIQRQKIEEFASSIESNVNVLRDKIACLAGRIVEKDKQLASAKSEILELKEQNVDPVEIINKFVLSNEFAVQCVTYVEEAFVKLKENLVKRKLVSKDILDKLSLDDCLEEE